jgi:hypothetical protein
MDIPMNAVQSDSELLQSINAKLSKLDTIEHKLDNINRRLDNVEKNYKTLDTRLKDLEAGVTNIEEEQEDLKICVENSVSKDTILPIYKRLTDMGNRNRRNNIVIHNVPEGYENSDDDDVSASKKLKQLVQCIAEKLGIEREIEVERIHRSPAARPKKPGENSIVTNNGNRSNVASTQHRKIYAKLLRYTDRDEILTKAVKGLKDFKLGGKETDRDVFITDDVEPVTMGIHKKLADKMKKMRGEGKFAFIPFTVPRVIKYRDGNGVTGGAGNSDGKTPGKLKTWRLSQDEIDEIYFASYTG